MREYLDSKDGDWTMSGDTAFHTALDTAILLLKAMRDDSTLCEQVASFAGRAQHALECGGRLLCCGNGGSLSQAIHFAEEWTGRFRHNRIALPAIALADPAQITCIANDFGYEEIFARQVTAHARPNDILVLLSTSGESLNLVRAAQTARKMDVGTVALTGRGGGRLANEVDVPIVVPQAVHSDRIQECHLVILHAIVESIEREMFPENYRSGTLPMGSRDGRAGGR